MAVPRIPLYCIFIGQNKNTLLWRLDEKKGHDKNSGENNTECTSVYWNPIIRADPLKLNSQEKIFKMSKNRRTVCEYCGIYGLQSHVVAHITQYVCRLCTNYQCDTRVTARLHNTLKHNNFPLHTTFITVREWKKPWRLNGGTALLTESVFNTTQAMLGTADLAASPAMQPVLWAFHEVSA